MESAKLEIALPRVSVIIAAYNEQAFIEATVASILESGFPCEVIVVDDGSTDQTPKILEAFGPKAKVTTHPTNRGKGAAIASGLRGAAGEVVIFCDAHLLGLRRHHLLSLVLPLIYGSARVTLGVNIPEGISPSLLGAAPLLLLTGQRAYFREDLMPLASEMEDLGYGVETFLFTKFPRDRTALVLLPGLIHLVKPDTSSPSSALAGYLRETVEIIDTLARLRGLAPKELTELRQRISALLAQYWAPAAAARDRPPSNRSLMGQVPAGRAVPEDHQDLRLTRRAGAPSQLAWSAGWAHNRRQSARRRAARPEAVKGLA